MLLALACLVAALAYAPAAKTAPGDLADLSVSKSDSPDPVTVGATLTYTIQVTNLGPDEATGATVSDHLPSQTDFLSATASSGSCERKGRNVNCSIGNLGDNPTKANSATVTIQVRPKRAGTISNTATVDSVENDPVTLNDQAQVTTTVAAAPRVAFCRGLQASVAGTPRADTLVGTGGPDVIAGLRGDDTIFGLGGQDLICAGGGGDRVGAGSAADRVFGGAGPDRLLGRAGPDRLAGNAGNDLLAGNTGGDVLRGGRGADRCVGGPGLDRTRGCES
jgi:uncharacterized repeat protein (TIGR01451 family)